MNALMDLTARAVSFITAVQTALLKSAIGLKEGDQSISILNIEPGELRQRLQKLAAVEAKRPASTSKQPDENTFIVRAVELVWVSKEQPNAGIAVDYTTTVSVALLEWINDKKRRRLFDDLQRHGKYPTPFRWRQAIAAILHKFPVERVKLAEALQFVPIQIVLAIGGGSFAAPEQRILQMWNFHGVDKENLLNADERKVHEKFEQLEKKSELSARTLLQENETLISRLLTNTPLAFEDVFKLELKEIEKNRKRRRREQMIAKGLDTSDPNLEQDWETKGAFDKAREMELYALAFSGGGIRSATFNLGILQGLAQKNLLHKFDYLSTVSGGGYIGSWFAAWIKREGSVVKVSNRLCTNLSPDPTGEELKPIRWLRMFSNYFAPNSSIMSADSWTIGVTWLRNTLLNQLVIFLLLLSILFAGNFFYELWTSERSVTFSAIPVAVWSFFLIVPVSILAGLGMHAYHSEIVPRIKIRREHTTRISKIIWVTACIGAYVLSAWIFSMSNHERVPESYTDHSTYGKLTTLWPAAVVTFVALSLVSILGKYSHCVKRAGIRMAFAVIMVYGTALLAAALGLLCLSFVWTLLEKIQHADNGFIADHDKQLSFIVGVPLILEVFSLTVVGRMALLGKYFPDERREWWGRMGGYIHRVSFLWILITMSALLGKDLIGGVFTPWWGAVTAGGWVALVGSTVKAAFSSSSSGKEKTPTAFSQILKIFVLAGPYLFALGLLIFLPALITPLKDLSMKFLGRLGVESLSTEVLNASIGILMFAAAFVLAKQIGVNEFSMHHFYRNRLVRAFLGATRRSTDRQRTSNPFTGFDLRDDEKLSKMTHADGYYGPYPILNTALNASEVTDLDRQDRKAESFIFSPLFSGFDFSMIRASADAKRKSYDYAYRETKNFAYRDDGPSIGTAMAISGAAVNPNQGYHTSAATSFLLTVFNVQMGWWIGNPRKNTWQSADPGFGLGYIMNNLTAKTNTRDRFIALSDGGHFDNMGLYEMVRRKCRFIVLCDAEQDDKFTCEGFANAIRRCRIDFGAEISITITPITNRHNDRYSSAHFALGSILYADESTGELLYIKSSIVNDEPVDVFEYALKNKTFPHQTTADQFFDEEQFESYRKLGLHIAEKAFRNGEVIRKFGWDNDRHM